MSTTSLEPRAALDQSSAAPTSAPIAGELTLRAAIVRVLVVYGIARLVLLIDGLVIAAVNHLSLLSILYAWDGNYYLLITLNGYPTKINPSSPLAFFPLLPMLGRGLAIVTRMPINWTLPIVVTVFGAGAGVLATVLVADRFGVRRGRQAGMLLVLFPGAFVIGMAYADGLAVTLSLATFVALSRRRWLHAGHPRALATACLPLVAIPLFVVALWVALSARRARALLAPALVPVGILAYFGYLWAHVGSAFTWERVQRTDWNVHVALPWVPPTGFTSYGMRTPESSAVTITCVVLIVIGIAALICQRAPMWWTLFATVVVVSVTLDATTWIEPRFVFDAFPIVLGLGAATPRRIFPFIAGLSLVLLALQFATSTPPNWTFFSP